MIRSARLADTNVGGDHVLPTLVAGLDAMFRHRGEGVSARGPAGPGTGIDAHRRSARAARQPDRADGWVQFPTGTRDPAERLDLCLRSCP